MAKQDQFREVFERLKAILQVYEPSLRVNENELEKYSLLGAYRPKLKKDLWYSKVEIGKAYVSYHLMAVYMFPDLLEGISEGLRKRMQGKSCFNFSAVDDLLFAELAELTRRSIERVRASAVLD